MAFRRRSIGHYEVGLSSHTSMTLSTAGLTQTKKEGGKDAGARQTESPLLPQGRHLDPSPFDERSMPLANQKLSPYASLKLGKRVRYRLANRLIHEIQR